MKQNQSKWLAIIVIWGREKWRSPSSLKNCVSESKQKRKRKIKRVREDCEGYIVRKRIVSEIIWSLYLGFSF